MPTGGAPVSASRRDDDSLAPKTPLAHTRSLQSTGSTGRRAVRPRARMRWTVPAIEVAF